jgi:hypothetical protein
VALLSLLLGQAPFAACPTLGTAAHAANPAGERDAPERATSQHHTHDHAWRAAAADEPAEGDRTDGMHEPAPGGGHPGPCAALMRCDWNAIATVMVIVQPTARTGVAVPTATSRAVPPVDRLPATPPPKHTV